MSKHYPAWREARAELNELPLGAGKRGQTHKGFDLKGQNPSMSGAASILLVNYLKSLPIRWVIGSK